MHAELVAAQPVGTAHTVDRATEPLSQTREQLVSGQMPESVVVRLEAVEVEKQEHGATGNIHVLLECRAQIGGEPTAVAQAGERVGHGLLADRVVGDDLARRQLGLADQLGHQGDLVLLERPTGANQPQRAGDLAGRGDDAHRDAQPPNAGLPDLNRSHVAPAAAVFILERVEPALDADRQVHR